MAEEILDVRGLLCPLPVLKARKKLAAMAPGALLRVIATDPAAQIDFPHFCQESGHELTGTGLEGGVWTFTIRRKAAGSSSPGTGEDGAKHQVRHV